MAELARLYHDSLQLNDLPPNLDDWDNRIMLLLDRIPREQKLRDTDARADDHPLMDQQTKRALHLSKNGSATGMDGCPYELWKTLQTHHEKALSANKPSFDIIKTLTRILTDIQTNGIDDRTDFTLGWMCPIYKKKDKTDISNY